MITIYDIAVKAGVSPSTVSKVMNDYKSIPAETKEKVRKAMAELNYIPNAGAKALSKGHSNNVGILAYFGLSITPFAHPLFVDVLDHFQEEMNEKGYDLLFVSSNVAGKDGSFYHNCISRDVAGALLFGDFSAAELQEVIDSSIPKVAFDYMGDKMSGVYSDNYDKMKALTMHLLENGHTKITFIHGDRSDVTSYRIKGFRDAFAEKGLPFDERFLVGGMYLDAQSIHNLTRNILRRVAPPTAIMYPDDLSAIEGMKVIKEFGLSIPEDISVTGFDGIYVSQLVSPHLTTVKQDASKIGKALASELIRQMDEKDASRNLIEIRGSLVLGESTGPVKK